MNKLGSLIKITRKERGLSPNELANLISVSRMTLTRLEENKTKLISLNTIILLSNILELDLCKIVKSYGKKLLSMDLKNVIISCKTICFDGKTIDKKALEELIKNNIISLNHIDNYSTNKNLL